MAGWMDGRLWKRETCFFEVSKAPGEVGLWLPKEFGSGAGSPENDTSRSVEGGYPSCPPVVFVFQVAL